MLFCVCVGFDYCEVETASVCIADVLAIVHLYFCWSFQAVALLVFIIGAVFSGNAVVFFNGYSSAGGWLAFVSFVIMVIETILIVGRFINFAFVYQYSLVVMIVVSECGSSIDTPTMVAEDHRVVAEAHESSGVSSIYAFMLYSC